MSLPCCTSSGWRPGGGWVARPGPSLRLLSRASSRTARRKQARAARALVADSMPPWTPDQLAGLAFGGFMLASVLLSGEFDAYVARSQRRELGLCEKCGGVFEPARCSEEGCPSRSQTGS